MTDLNPEIWDNETLGAAAPNERLDVIERQILENRAAKFEGREPRTVVSDNTHPGWTPPVMPRTGTTPSNYIATRFVDERPNDVQQSGEGIKPEGLSETDWTAQSE